MNLAREAFLLESGGALLARHQGIDPLFTPDGYRAYAEDLLERMTNPWLRDQTARVIRDTPRKLGWNDRLIGTMRLALDAGITPWRFALGVAAALETLPPSANKDEQLRWPEPDQPPGRKARLVELTTQARQAYDDGKP
jgi:mannitol-1-phosphate/altronate dehydrogenase